VRLKKSLKIAAIISVAIFAAFLFRYYQIQTNTLYGIRIMGDGAGGAYALYEDHIGGNIYAQKISPEGKLLWGEKGILLGRNKAYFYLYSMLELGSIDSEGIIATWPGMLIQPELTFFHHVVILDSNGGITSQKTVESYNTASNGPENVPQFQTRIVPVAGSIFGDIAVTRSHSYANTAWQGYLRLGLDKYGGKPLESDIYAVGDGSGGVIVSWRDLRSAASGRANIYAQRVNAEGELLWQAGGVNATLTSYNPRYNMLSDGQGGVIIAYNFRDDGESHERRLQRLGPDGRTLWPENGLIINSGVIDSQELAADGQGGVIAGWGVKMSFFKAEKAFIQRIDSKGAALWGESGLQLNR
jgi:hypothetical protein